VLRQTDRHTDRQTDTQTDPQNTTHITKLSHDFSSISLHYMLSTCTEQFQNMINIDYIRHRNNLMMRMNIQQ